MTLSQRNFAYAEAENYNSINDFISDMLLSSAFTQTDDSAELDSALSLELVVVYRVRKLPFNELLKFFNRTQSEVAHACCIPLRTVQSWALDERKCAPWIRLLLAEKFGVFNRKKSPRTFTVDDLCRRYALQCKNFAEYAKDKGWQDLDRYKQYTTGTPGWESTDNAAGGLRVDWAFNMTSEEIDLEAPHRLVEQLRQILIIAEDDKWDAEQLHVFNEMLDNL